MYCTLYNVGQVSSMHRGWEWFGWNIKAFGLPHSDIVSEWWVWPIHVHVCALHTRILYYTGEEHRGYRTCMTEMPILGICGRTTYMGVRGD